ncbi:MAG: transposase, partial [Pseudonocardiales bacterium]|nr:transposase [Pseudonocardiales bacterium]
ACSAYPTVVMEAPVFTERTSVGLDVHARSVAAAAIDGVTGELVQAKLTPSHEHIRSWIGELAGPVAVAYEAGPTGFGLYQALTAAGVRAWSRRRRSCSARRVIE